MASVFKRKWTRNGKVSRSKLWYGQYRDHHGKLIRTSLLTDRGASENLLAELQRNAELRRRGRLDAFDDHLKTPLKDHIEAFRRYMHANARSADHITDTIRYVELVTSAFAMAFIADLTADCMRTYMSDLRARGKSLRTVNAYLTAMKSFTKWAVRERRAVKDPLDLVGKLNAKTDVKRRRRTLSDDQAAHLIKTAATSKTEFRGLPGPGRAALYSLAVAGGLRAGELASLTTASLLLEGDAPYVVVEAKSSKRRRRDEQPLPHWIPAALAPWMAHLAAASSRGKIEYCRAVDGAGDRLQRSAAKRQAVKALEQLRPGAWSSMCAVTLFPGYWRHRTAEMLREDLIAAKIPYADNDGRVFDFHSWRHQFISNLAAAGVHPKTAQKLARHSTIDLTMNLYTHVALADVAGALDELPNPHDEKARQKLRATGTDDRQLRADKDLRARMSKTTLRVAQRGKMGKEPSRIENEPEAQGEQQLNEAEGMGFEPTTHFWAPDFESGRWPIRLPSSG